MKIAYISDVLFPFTKGGSERRVWEVSKRLARKNDVHILTVDWNEDSLNDRNVIIDGVKIHYLIKLNNLYNNGKRSFINSILFSISVFAKLLHERYDIIHCNQSPILHIFPSKIISYYRKIPLVITWHEVWGDYWYEYLGNRMGLIGKFIEHIILNIPDIIITVSSSTKKSISLLNKRPDKIYTLFNGINLNEINNSEPNKYKYDVVYLGRLVKTKNVDVLLKSLELLSNTIPHLKCAIIGDGPERENLEKLTKKLDIENIVKFHGFLKNDYEVYRKLKSSKVFISCSTLEGFGIVFIEAMACRLPVIGINHKNNAATELIKDGKNGFLVELSPKIISNKLKILLKDYNLRREMGKNALNLSKNYDWEKIINEINMIYQNIRRAL